MAKRGPSIIQRVVLFFLKVVYIVPFFAFGIWLLSMVYLPGREVGRPPSVRGEKQPAAVFKVLMPKHEALPRGHFHMVDEYLQPQGQHQPVCVVCHGAYAHGKDKKLRAMLNMHDGYIACAVCHVRQDTGQGDGKRAQFLWVDRESGAFKRAVEGEYGKYPAQIFPVTDAAQGTRQVYTPISAEAAQAFLQRLPGLSKDEASKAREKLHAPLSEKPVSCADCHKTDGYLDLRALGFPQQRIDNLVSTEFVGMIEKYETFHLPSVLDFGGP
jgi:mono/diheme cytochrome c family protein